MSSVFQSTALSLWSADKHEIHAIHVWHGAENLVILSHGLTVHKDEGGIYQRFAEQALAADFDSIRFDFRGHGQSGIADREMTVCGEILDFMAVVRWAREQGYRRLYHVTASFGAAVTLLAVSQFRFDDFAAMVFLNPVINYQHTFTHSIVPWGKTFFNQVCNDELAHRPGTPIPERNFTLGPQVAMELLLLQPHQVRWPEGLPLLVLHGDQDSKVPHEDAADYCRRHPQSTRLHTISGADHGFGEKLEEVLAETVAWFRKHHT